MTATKARWDTREYARIAEATYHDGKLSVRFEDGSCASVDLERLLPPGTPPANWASVSVSPYDLAVPTREGHVEVPWDVIRALTDPDYSARLARMVEEQRRRIGLRIRELREQRGLTGRELAARAGITPRRLSRIEHGHHEVVFSILDRILTAMGCTLHDLVMPLPEESAAATD